MKALLSSTPLWAALACVLTACSQSPSGEASAELEAAFQGAHEATKAQVDQARAALEAKKYTDAMLMLKRAMDAGKASEEQRQAVSAAVGEVMKAMDHDPRIDNPVLHRTMADLILRVNGEN